MGRGEGMFGGEGGGGVGVGLVLCHCTVELCTHFDVFCSKWRLLDDNGSRYTEQSDMKIVSEKGGADTSLRFMVRAHKVRSLPSSSSPLASCPLPPLPTSHFVRQGPRQRHLVARSCGHSHCRLGQVHKNMVAWYDARARDICNDTVTMRFQ